MAECFIEGKKRLVLAKYSLNLIKKGLIVTLGAKDAEFISYQLEKCLAFGGGLELVESNVSMIQHFIAPSFTKIEKIQEMEEEPTTKEEEILYYEEDFLEEYVEEELIKEIEAETTTFMEEGIQEEEISNEEPPITETAELETTILESFSSEEIKNPYKISDKTKEVLRRAIHKPIERFKDMENPEEEPALEHKQNYYEPLHVEPQRISIPKKVILEEDEVADDVVSKELLRPTTESFTAIFNQRVEKEKTNTSKYAELLSLDNLNSKLDCLVACAYYLIERENFERFTLKQINTLSKPLLEEAIGHETIKDALERHLIKIIPDYTGIATTLEYTITEKGVRYFENQIQS